MYVTERNITPKEAPTNPQIQSHWQTLCAVFVHEIGNFNIRL